MADARAGARAPDPAPDPQARSKPTRRRCWRDSMRTTRSFGRDTGAMAMRSTDGFRPQPVLPPTPPTQAGFLPPLYSLAKS